MKRALALLIALPAALYSQQPWEYPDVLDLRGTPSGAEDRSVWIMSDLGAWHGHSLPATTAQAGVFPGPFLMESSLWMSPGLVKPTVSVVADGATPAALEDATDLEARYLPGRLHQAYSLGDLRVKLDLVFVSSRSSLLRATISNTGTEPVRLLAGWEGKAFPAWDVVVARSGITVRHPDWDSYGLLSFAEAGVVASVCDSTCSGFTRRQPEWTELDPGESHRTHVVQSVYLDPGEEAVDRTTVAAALGDPAVYFRANEERWSGYLNSVLSGETEWSATPSYRRIAVKALVTLVNNWRSASGDLRHDGLFPSYAAPYFNGFWAWDSWKHAVALAQFEPALARDQIRAMFDYQDSLGMIADVIYRDASENNWRDTKPPLAAWAVWSVYEATGDTGFLREMLPQLLRYHRWWFEQRDHDGDGLAEYGSTDGTIVAARWESGMDNAVRFDSTGMLENSPGAWSMDQESVDLNSYLFADKTYLAAIAEAIGDGAVAAEMRNGAEVLGSRIREAMFDEGTGYFHDIDIDSGEPIRVFGPEGWIPLWSGVATREQAAGVRAAVTSADHFAATVPFPTVSVSHPDFTPDGGYWRGPVWLDQAYFGVRALERYGFDVEARELTRRLFDNPEGLRDAPGPIRENYHPLTGAGLEANHFSWSAAHYLLLFMGK